MHKKGYAPEHTKLKDMQGRQVHDRLRAKLSQIIMSKSIGP